MIVRFLVELSRLTGPRFVNGRVNSLRRESPAFNNKLPRPLDRLLLEIITEAPIPQHLKKGVMICVESDVFEVVMFPSGANAFLRVGDARRIPRRFLLSEKNGHELVHASIGEKQIGRVWHERRRSHNRVLFFAKEIEKTLTNLGASHAAGIKSDIKKDAIM